MELTSPTPGNEMTPVALYKMQLALGCAGCRWCDEAARAEGSPCCNRPWGYEAESDGTCDSREEPLPQFFEIPPIDITGGVDAADWVQEQREGGAADV